MSKLTGAALDRAVANAMGLKSVKDCEKWGEHMILDEGCAERGCPMHDERETKGVVFIRKEWVGLTDAELMECTVFKRFDYDPPYIDKDGVKHVGSMEVSLRATYENINNKLKEKNA